jgi:hypothetical protein
MALGVPIALATGCDTTFTQEPWFMLMVVTPHRELFRISTNESSQSYNRHVFIVRDLGTFVKVFKKCKVAYQNIHLHREISQFTIFTETYR